MNNLAVGFTGTQIGMTGTQMLEFAKWIKDLAPGVFHHGDCVGADAQAHDLVWDLANQGYFHCLIVVHPPQDQRRRAFKGMSAGPGSFIEIREPKPYLDRNKDIVDESKILIAAPRTLKEQQRSGTWSTVRYARAQHHAIQFLEP